MTATPDPTVPAQAREAVDAEPDAGDLLAPDSAAPGMPAADPGAGEPEPEGQRD